MDLRSLAEVVCNEMELGVVFTRMNTSQTMARVGVRAISINDVLGTTKINSLALTYETHAIRDDEVLKSGRRAAVFAGAKARPLKTSFRRPQAENARPGLRHLAYPALNSGAAFDKFSRKVFRQSKTPSVAGRLFNISLTMSYFHTGTRTIIGAEAFHCPVREGKEWDHLAMVIRLNLLLGWG